MICRILPPSSTLPSTSASQAGQSFGQHGQAGQGVGPYRQAGQSFGPLGSPTDSQARDWRLATLFVLLGSVAAVVSSFLVRFLLARRLAPEGFGVFTLAVGIATATAGCAALGLGAASARRVSLLRARGEVRDAAHTARRALLVAAGSGTIGAVLLAALAPRLAQALGKPALAAPLVALSPAVLALAVGNAGLGVARAFGDVAGRALWRDGLGGVLRALGVIAALAAGAGAAGAALGFAAGALGGELAFLLYAGWHGWLRATAIGEENPPSKDGRIPSPDRASSGLVRDLGPFAAMGVLYQAAQWFDVLLLGALAPAAEVGLYGVARGLERVLELGSEAGAHRFLPAATEAHHHDGARGLAQVYRQTRRLMLALLWPPLLLCLLAPRELLAALFGAGYAGGGAALRVLAAGLLLTAGLGYNDRALLAAGEERRVARFTLLAVLAGVLVAALSARGHGGLGAAAGWATMIAVQNVLCSAALRRLRGVSPGFGELARQALLAALPPLALFGLLRGLGVAPLAAALAAALGAGVAVLAVARRRDLK